MKKHIIAGMVGVLCFALVGCGGQGTPNTGEGADEAAQQATEQDSSNPLESIIAKAQADFSDTSQKLLDEQAKVFSEVGDTFDDYLTNADKLQDWYDLAVSETEGLAERAVEYGREYYQAVVDNVDLSEDRNWDRATEDFYDAIYDDAFDDYYDAIYEDAFDEAYDAYYDGIVADAYDTVPYDDWSDASGDAYEAWADAHSAVYEAWSDGHSDVYSDYSDVRGAFYGNDFDVEGLFAPVEIVDKSESAESDEADGKSSNEETPAKSDKVSEGAGGGESDATGGSKGDFKATMDEYEAFFDEYVEFMKKYNEDPSSLELVAKYGGMMKQYSDTMEALDSIDEDSLSTEDQAYLLEVQTRINQKLLEVAQ